MRISDWSSDVCSSDLRASGLELGPVAQGSAIVLRIGGRALGLRQAVDDDDRGATQVDGVTLEEAERAVVHAPALHPDLVEAGHVAVHRLPLAATGESGRRDRKSTRLNSSH